MTLKIDYDSDGFPAGALVANGRATLTTSWDELLAAALTVGRPNRHYVFRHGRASSYEALFRLSLVRMALEQPGPLARRLRRTSAARTLDPSEKGAVNYFLGLTFCKLFAERLLFTPWLLHLDVFRPMLNPVLVGRSRPDLVGEMTGGGWIVLESKGRVYPPDETTKEKAKDQAQRLLGVNGALPHYQIGGVTYFRNEVPQFYWRDPEPDPDVRNPIKVTVGEDAWRYYYAPILNLLRSDLDGFERMTREPELMPVEGADIKVGIHPEVLRALSESRWEDARSIARSDNLGGTGLSYRADGIAVVAGGSWLMPFDEGQE
jgi:hypothetical protein